tara:strand:- start:83 stop:547 length:465 start_codon:yes stop_codon:yes gene_type:complete
VNKRLKILKGLIDSGTVPAIKELATNSEEYSYEDVIALDYGFVQDLYIGSEQFETWFTYIGPEPIKLNDLVLNKNEMIEIVLAEFNMHKKHEDTFQYQYDSLSSAREEAYDIAYRLESNVPIYKQGEGYSLWQGETLVEWIKPPNFDEHDYHGI